LEITPLVTTIEEPNFEKEILIPLKQKQQAQRLKDCSSVGGVLEGDLCLVTPAVQETVYEPQMASYTPLSEGLVGSYGYISPMNNCVDFTRQFGKVQTGNPDTWVATTNKPFIGAAVLFYYRHTAIVVGLHPGGDVELAQANCPGCKTRYSPFELRGYF
jgi:hypothetical protein